MKKSIILLIFLISLAGCSTQKNYMNISSVNEVHQINFNKSKNVLIDVRTAEEYAEGHISDAINIDVKSENFDAEIKKLDPKKNYFVYCKSGTRSTIATEKMNAAGFQSVTNLKDGYISYQSEE